MCLIASALMVCFVGLEWSSMRWDEVCRLRSEIWAKPGKRKSFCFSSIFPCNENCSVAHWKHCWTDCYSLSSESDKWTPVKRQLSQKHLMSFLVRESNLFIPSLFVQSSVHSVFMLSVFISAVLHSGYQKCVWILGVVLSLVVVLFYALNNIHGLIIL